MRASDLPSLHTFITNGYRLRTELANAISAVERYRRTAKTEPASAAKLKALLTAAIAVIDAGQIVVTVPVASVTVAGGASGAVGTTAQLTATVLPANATNKAVTWTSATPAVATVNASGLVTRVAVGTAVITATSVADGTKKGTATVTVA